MINKRPFVEENCCGVVSKHPKHCAHENVDIVPPQNESPKCDSDNEGDGSPTGYPFEARLSSDLTTCVFKESANRGSCSSPKYLWVNSSIIDADCPISHLSLFPEYFEHTDHLRVGHKSDDVLASAVDHPPQKLVPVGPKHQAYVPEWDQQGSCSSDHLTKKMGTCVISIPEAEVDCLSEEGLSRDDCMCPDSGSIRCVRQHVSEARENLRENIGPKLFEDLGFCEMGEDVAKRWTEEEERIFEEVVFENPFSSGKNFWDQLSVAFPSRDREDFVSYYFNVLVLRKRAGQNRFDPTNIDSDNDEWQQNDDGSVVESPVGQDTPGYSEGDHLLDCHENLGDMNDNDDGGDCDKANIDARSKITAGGEDCDVQDNSCTSYEYQQDGSELGCLFDRGNMGNDARDCRVG